MKFIILSDIHGNIHALNACLNQIDKMDFDAIIWCGDDNVRYINPGSIGISTDEIIGAQFSVLELNDDYEKIEEYQINYDIKVPIEELKQTALYNEGVKWGKLLVKELETGIDYPQICLKEYNRIKQEHHIKEESMEIWNVALNNIINS